ncbi:hypothetical protein NKI16_33600, partial [Mesorhizobium sp. M0698]
MSYSDVPAKGPSGDIVGKPRRNATETRFYLTNEFGLIALIVVFALGFKFTTEGFFSAFNLFTLGRIAAVNIMIGLAMMVVVMTGGLNLAVGAIGVCAAMTCGYLIEVVGL